MKSKARLQIEAMTTSEIPSIRQMAKALLDPKSTMQSMYRSWRRAMGAPATDASVEISKTDMESMLHLGLEKKLDLIKASGFTIVSKTTGEEIIGDLKIAAQDGAIFNPVLVANCIANETVITVGTAVELGYPLMELYIEAMLSNGTQLPADGFSIINRCVSNGTDSSHVCGASEYDCVLLDSEAPVGNVLKPSTYVAADFDGVLKAQIKSDDSQTEFAYTT